MAKPADTETRLINLYNQIAGQVGEPLWEAASGQPEPAQPPEAAQPPEPPQEIAGEQPAPWSKEGRLQAARSALKHDFKA